MFRERSSCFFPKAFIFDFGAPAPKPKIRLLEKQGASREHEIVRLVNFSAIYISTTPNPANLGGEPLRVSRKQNRQNFSSLVFFSPKDIRGREKTRLLKDFANFFSAGQLSL
jgi:hypothetical protein